MERGVISIGANLGDRRAALQGAVDALASTEGLRVLAVSDPVETEPVGGPDQPKYLNAIVLVETVLDPHAVLARTQEIEAAWGRTRDVRWGPRTLDVDLIDFGVVHDDDVLTLPHPRARERAFVLVPWLQVDPKAVLTGTGALADLDIDSTGVRPSTEHLDLP